MIARAAAAADNGRLIHVGTAPLAVVAIAVAIVVAVVVVAAGACATTRPAPTAIESGTPMVSAEAAPEKIVVDVHELHPASESRTIGDGRALAPKLLSSVALERNALTGADGVEPWLSRVLIAWLVDHGAEVRSDAAAAAAVTAKLVGVRFGSSKQDALVAVYTDGDDHALHVRYWAGEKDMSECAPALKVPLTYVQFEGVLLDPSQRVVASFAEIVATPPPSMRAEVALKGREPCAAVVDAFSDEFVPTETELVKAATETLDAGFRALVAPPPAP